jgi:hypothetical protein
MGRNKRAKTVIKLSSSRVIKLSSSRSEAHDEGPRLLPLDKEHQARFGAMDYYIDLADKMLHPKPK